MNPTPDNARRFTAWSAILGGVFAYLNVTLAVMATGGDFAATLHGATMLAAPTETRDLFRWAMCADVLGFYLPVLVIGGYLWHRFRAEGGALGDMAALAITLYAVLGIAGAAMQMAVLDPLAHLHAGGDATVKAAAEAAWTAIANASQKGLWWAEGPVVLFWGTVVGSHLRRAGWGKPVLVLLKITGWSFGLFFLLGMFPGFTDLTKLVLMLVVLIFPAWMLLFGWLLLRRPMLPATAG
jgi:hypothetical protein